MDALKPTDRRPVPFKTRIEKSGLYTPKYPTRPSKEYDQNILNYKCIRAQNPRTFKKKTKRTYGSKEDVYRGRAMVTRGGLRKADLDYRRVNVNGKIRYMVFKKYFYDDQGIVRRDAKKQIPIL
jgi:hypothetical protein